MLLEFTMVSFLHLFLLVFVIRIRHSVSYLWFDKYTYIWQCLFNGFDIFSIDRLSFGFALCAGSIPINGPGLIKRTSYNIYATNHKHTNRPSGGGAGGFNRRRPFIFTEGPRSLRADRE